MKIQMLGTGNGGAIECYNTCFIMENNNKILLVDGGGGNEILKRLKRANININDIHDIFLTHSHTDHILGIVWVLRIICSNMRFKGNYDGFLNIYGNEKTILTIKQIMEMLYPPIKEYFGNSINLNIVKDREIKSIIDLDFEFFDVLSKKEEQLGFVVGEMVFCGDEPLKPELFDFAKNKKWLLHECFCLDNEEPIFNAHNKHHCTVKEAGQIATKINAQNLVLFHTEDNNLKNRKDLYTKEAKEYFNGKVFVPDDMETIIIE